MNILFFRPKRFTLKSYKRLYFVCKNLFLFAYKSSSTAKSSGDPLFSVPLKVLILLIFHKIRASKLYGSYKLIIIFIHIIIQGCEVTPFVNLSAARYEVKLEVPSAEGMTDMYLRFNGVSRGSSTFKILDCC